MMTESNEPLPQACLLRWPVVTPCFELNCGLQAKPRSFSEGTFLKQVGNAFKLAAWLMHLDAMSQLSVWSFPTEASIRGFEHVDISKQCTQILLLEVAPLRLPKWHTLKAFHS